MGTDKHGWRNGFEQEKTEIKDSPLSRRGRRAKGRMDWPQKNTEGRGFTTEARSSQSQSRKLFGTSLRLEPISERKGREFTTKTTETQRAKESANGLVAHE